MFKKLKKTNLIYNILFKEKKVLLWAIISLVTSLISMVLTIINCDIIKNFIDSIINNRNFKNGIWLLIFVTILCTTNTYINTYAKRKFSIIGISKFRQCMVSHIMKFEIPYFGKENNGKIVSKFANDVNTLGNLLENFLDIVYYIILVIGIYIYMLFVNIKLFYFVLILIPLLSVISKYLNKPLGIMGSNLYKSLSDISSVIFETINGIQIIKAFNLQKLFLNKFKNVINETQRKTLEIENKMAIVAGITVNVNVITPVICIFYAAQLVTKSEMTPGQLFSIIPLINYLSQYLSLVLHIISKMQVSLGALNNIMDLFDVQIESDDGYKYNDDGNNVVEFCNVSFSYFNELPLIQDFNLVIEKGKVIAITGESGSGKSTILKLICGFYKNYSGNIKIFGHEINEWEIEKLRSHISLVSQETFLFNDTILQNIEVGQLNATIDEVTNASKLAGIHDFIISLPNGYNTIIDENGTNLSGGQKQRLSIARAILKGAEIIIFDEPTSALDSELEAFIKQSIIKVGQEKTIIIVTHSLSLINEIKDVIVLRDGKLYDNKICSNAVF